MLIISLLLFQSCIDEQLSVCPPQSIRIYFKYMPKNGYVGIDDNDVKSITLFVFDKGGKYLSQDTYSNITLTNKYFISLDIEPGIYTFVAWANLSEPYRTDPSTLQAGVTDINTALTYLNRSANDSVNTILPHLFFGNYMQAEVKAEGDQRFDVLLDQNTNKVNLKVKGLMPTTDIFSYVITDDNGKYKFDNSFAPDKEFTYINTTKFENSNELNTSLTVLRLAGDRKPMLKLYNKTSGKLLYEQDLVYLISILNNQGRLFDWQNTHEFDIVLTFAGTGEASLGVTVSVNGWVVIDDGVEVHA